MGVVKRSVRKVPDDALHLGGEALGRGELCWRLGNGNGSWIRRLQPNPLHLAFLVRIGSGLAVRALEALHVSDRLRDGPDGRVPALPRRVRGSPFPIHNSDAPVVPSLPADAALAAHASRAVPCQKVETRRTLRCIAIDITRIETLNGWRLFEMRICR